MGSYDSLQQAVHDALGDVTLDQPLSRGQVLDCLSAVHAGDMLLHSKSAVTDV